MEGIITVMCCIVYDSVHIRTLVTTSFHALFVLVSFLCVLLFCISIRAIVFVLRLVGYSPISGCCIVFYVFFSCLLGVCNFDATDCLGRHVVIIIDDLFCVQTYIDFCLLTAQNSVLSTDYVPHSQLIACARYIC